MAKNCSGGHICDVFVQVVREMDRAHVGAGQDLQWAGAGAVGELELSVLVDPDRTGAVLLYFTKIWRYLCIWMYMDAFSEIVFGQ